MPYVICISVLVRVRMGASSVVLYIWSKYSVGVYSILLFCLYSAGCRKSASAISQIWTSYSQVRMIGIQYCMTRFGFIFEIKYI